MFDSDIDNTSAEEIIEAYKSSEVRDNGNYIFSQVELEKTSFQIIYPGKDVLVSSYFKGLAAKVIGDIHRLNDSAKANTPEGEVGEHSLHYVQLSEAEVELHYVYNLANASSGVFFKISEGGLLEFDDWG